MLARQLIAENPGRTARGRILFGGPAWGTMHTPFSPSQREAVRLLVDHGALVAEVKDGLCAAKVSWEDLARWLHAVTVMLPREAWLVYSHAPPAGHQLQTSAPDDTRSEHDRDLLDLYADLLDQREVPRRPEDLAHPGLGSGRRSASGPGTELVLVHGPKRERGARVMARRLWMMRERDSREAWCAGQAIQMSVAFRDKMPESVTKVTERMREIDGGEDDLPTALGVLEWMEASLCSDFLTSDWMYGARRLFVSRLSTATNFVDISRALLQLLIQGLDLQRLAALVRCDVPRDSASNVRAFVLSRHVPSTTPSQTPRRRNYRRRRSQKGRSRPLTAGFHGKRDGGGQQVGFYGLRTPRAGSSYSHRRSL